MEISAAIKGISYTPLLCTSLPEYPASDLAEALASSSAFLLKMPGDKSIAVSWWVSPKRTRSYPYARVYNTLAHSARKATVIPVWKDEGRDGDRDYMQWDTVSLMSLLNVYVIIAYYAEADRSSRYPRKITRQRFDVGHVRSRLNDLCSYQSSALHWNMERIDEIGEVAERALAAYSDIAKRLKVVMHSKDAAMARINTLRKDRNEFMELSRRLAQKAQEREAVTVQPKELVHGAKATITIRNYLGGLYYFTADEASVRPDERTIRLVEAKHTRSAPLPAMHDIKDGLLKMVLFTNLSDVRIGSEKYEAKGVLKLTSAIGFNYLLLSDRIRENYDLLLNEKDLNGFEIEVL